ncbi:hypothetical protein MUA27_10485 [Mammaliicoccus sciuri]|uniref:hypothetical protein n=1 Tax=Mammaliicoccus sciuri TaxID=1296 RepID=UPI0021CE32E6|nr:hypothetical protein [Mammaliicoccus sciuri]UXU77295.1 hypothetical protein MUA27_10485 [Mammaliicoccus sciuri]
MELIKIITIIVMLSFWAYVFLQPVYKKRMYKRKNRLFIDSQNKVMYITPGSKTTDEEIEDIGNYYGEHYVVKLVDRNTIIKGINTYTIDYRKSMPSKED